MTQTSRTLLHTSKIKMRWGDMDALGHLNNTYYFRYMEQGRLEWLDHIGAPIEPGQIGPVVAHLSCDFKKELIYPATVELAMYCTKLGRSSMQVEQEFKLEGDDETIYAIGRSVMVWVDYSTGKSLAIPDDVRKRCAE